MFAAQVTASKGEIPEWMPKWRKLWQFYKCRFYPVLYVVNYINTVNVCSSGNGTGGADTGVDEVHAQPWTRGSVRNKRRLKVGVYIYIECIAYILNVYSI